MSTASVADKKKKDFGIDDEGQRHLETYTCKLNKNYGVLYIWQRFCAFESMLNQKVVVHFKDVISLQKYLVTSGVELVVKSQKGGRREYVFSSLSVPSLNFTSVNDAVVSLHSPLLG